MHSNLPAVQKLISRAHVTQLKIRERLTVPPTGLAGFSCPKCFRFCRRSNARLTVFSDRSPSLSFSCCTLRIDTVTTLFLFDNNLFYTFKSIGKIWIEFISIESWFENRLTRRSWNRIHRLISIFRTAVWEQGISLSELWKLDSSIFMNHLVELNEHGCLD